MIAILINFDSLNPTIMYELIQQIIDNPYASMAIVGNLIIIESLLSVDNAAVLATMVKDLPENQKVKALKYGIWGAYIFRGIAMLFASLLIQIWWLKPLGGLYLLFIVFDYWKGKKTKTKKDDLLDKKAIGCIELLLEQLVIFGQRYLW